MPILIGLENGIVITKCESIGCPPYKHSRQKLILLKKIGFINIIILLLLAFSICIERIYQIRLQSVIIIVVVPVQRDEQNCSSTQ